MENKTIETLLKELSINYQKEIICGSIVLKTTNKGNIHVYNDQIILMQDKKCWCLPNKPRTLDFLRNKLVNE